MCIKVGAVQIIGGAKEKGHSLGREQGSCGWEGVVLEVTGMNNMEKLGKKDDEEHGHEDRNKLLVLN